MKIAFKSLIAAAAFIVAAGAAGAAPVTVVAGSTVYKGHTASGIEVLTLSDDALSELLLLKAAITAAGAQLVTTQTNDGQILSAKVTAPLSSLTVEDTTDQLNSIAVLNGLTASVPAQRNVSSGGAVTLTDLEVDIVNKKVFAKVLGANGVGTLTHVPLWDIGSIAGSTAIDTLSGGTKGSNLTVSGLRLTSEGFNAIATSLGLLNLGKASLASISDYGTLAISLTSAVAVVPDPQACAVAFKTTKLSASSFNTQVTVMNISGDTSTAGWKVNWTYNKDTMLSNVKNAKVTRKSLKSYSAQPVSANATLDPWGMTTFTFRGQTLGGIPTISDLNATLGGQACSVSTAP